MVLITKEQILYGEMLDYSTGLTIKTKLTASMVYNLLLDKALVNTLRSESKELKVYTTKGTFTDFEITLSTTEAPRDVYTPPTPTPTPSFKTGYIEFKVFSITPLVYLIDKIGQHLQGHSFDGWNIQAIQQITDNSFRLYYEKQGSLSIAAVIAIIVGIFVGLGLIVYGWKVVEENNTIQEEIKSRDTLLRDLTEKGYSLEEASNAVNSIFGTPTSTTTPTEPLLSIPQTLNTGLILIVLLLLIISK